MAVNGKAWAHGSATHGRRVLGNLVSAFFQQPMISHANAIAPTTRGGSYGVVGTRELLVTGTGGLGYSIAPGRVVATGTFATAQGAYVGYNDAAATGTLAAHSAFIRHDLICYRVRDTDEDASGSEDDLFHVVQGIAASTDPAVPSSLGSLVILSRAVVPATSGTPTFTDLRTRVTAIGGTHRCTSATRPTGEALYEGMRIYEEDTDTELINTSATTTASWVILSESRQAWTPSLFQPGLIASTTNNGWYHRSRGTFRAVADVAATAAGAAAGLFVSTPVTLAAIREIGGTWHMDAGGTISSGVVKWSTTTGFVLFSGATQYATALAAGHTLNVSIQGSY